jgi:hypothetical protein
MNFSYIRSLLLFPISFLILAGCEQKFDSVIDNFYTDYQASAVLPLNEVYFNQSDSLVTISIQFTNSVQGIDKVYCDIFASDGSKINSSPVNLVDNGNPANGDAAADDKIYSNKFPFSKYNPNGIYNSKYFVADLSGETKEVAIGTFKYDNGQNNVAPLISNLMLVDSTAKDVPITFSIDVTDSNGLSDIKKVFYELFRPNGTKVFNSQGISEFPLFDDGNTAVDGDAVANDGIFTQILIFPNLPSVPSGDWRFEFTAEDRAGALSNKIVKTVKVL